MEAKAPLRAKGGVSVTVGRRLLGSVTKCFSTRNRRVFSSVARVAGSNSLSPGWSLASKPITEAIDAPGANVFATARNRP